MALRLVSAPAVEPVSLAEAKLHLRVDTSADDALIGGLIATARAHVEEMCRPQVAMLTQTWEMLLDAFPDKDEIELRPWPLQSVTSISYTSPAAATTVWPNTNYVVDTYSEPGRVSLVAGVSWPPAPLRRLNGVAIRFVAGYGDAGTAAPLQLRQAVLLLVGHWYENREPVITTGAFPQNIPMTVAALVGPWRREV